MASTYDPIATTTLGSAASSITFSSIPATYTDLRVVFVGTVSSSGFKVRMRFNSNTATNYSYTWLGGQGSSAYSSRTTNDTGMSVAGEQSGTISTIFGINIDVFSYAGSTYKTALSEYYADANGSGNVERYVGLWRVTSAINTITLDPFSGNFNAGTIATLYGIKSA